MNNYSTRENNIRRAHLLFLIINAAFSILLIIRILRPPVWELWFIPVVIVMGVGIWVVYFKNLFSLRARTIIIAGTSLLFLYFYGTHLEVLFFEFPLCIGFFTTACAALDEHVLTIAGVAGYFLGLLYHVIVLGDPSIIAQSYLSIIVMFTVLFYSRFLIAKHSKELESFDESIKRMEDERKSRENFLANVSHELRTPVNAIMGMADILLQRELDGDVREDILAIEKAGRRLSNQINDILDFSEIISDSLIDESESYLFSDLVKELKSIHTGMDSEGNTSIVWDIDSRIPAVLYGDRKKIRHIFINILGNAFECQSGGSVYISVRSRNEVYGINLLISVRDEGEGIKQEDINRAYYGRFEGSGSSNRQEGLKLGLSIANGLVRFMNGFVIFESKEGVGTTVKITIPQRVMDSEYWKEEAIDTDDESDLLDLSDKKILVVDDDYMNLNVAKKMLSIYGGEIKQADSGFSALELCKIEQFDIIFMDHMMPGMDGIETYRAIRSNAASRNKDTIFIALTANAVSGAKETFISEGFADFVSKPIDRKALERAIKKVVKDGSKRNNTEMLAEPEHTENDRLNILEKYGVNTGDALNYCAGSEDFYYMMLSDFSGQIEDRIAELSEYMESGDEDNYRIKIHALKSNTKTLGFDEISEMSRLSEMACKEGRFEEARESHAGIMDKLREIEDLINKIK